jgi:hypothetical protein
MAARARRVSLADGGLRADDAANADAAGAADRLTHPR